MQQFWQRNFDRSDNLIRQGIGSEAFFRSIEQELPPVVLTSPVFLYQVKC